MVTTRRRQEESRPRLVLPGHVGEVQPTPTRRWRGRRLPIRLGQTPTARHAPVGRDELREGLRRRDPHPVNEAGLPHVLGGDDDVLAAGGLRGEQRLCGLAEAGLVGEERALRAPDGARRVAGVDLTGRRAVVIEAIKLRES